MLEGSPAHEGIKTVNSAAGKKDAEGCEEGQFLSFLLSFSLLASMTSNSESLSEGEKLQMLLNCKWAVNWVVFLENIDSENGVQEKA